MSVLEDHKALLLFSSGAVLAWVLLPRYGVSISGVVLGLAVAGVGVFAWLKKDTLLSFLSSGFSATDVDTIPFSEVRDAILSYYSTHEPHIEVEFSAERYPYYIGSEDRPDSRVVVPVQIRDMRTYRQVTGFLDVPTYGEKAISRIEKGDFKVRLNSDMWTHIHANMRIHRTPERTPFEELLSSGDPDKILAVSRIEADRREHTMREREFQLKREEADRRAKLEEMKIRREEAT